MDLGLFCFVTAFSFSRVSRTGLQSQYSSQTPTGLTTTPRKTRRTGPSKSYVQHWVLPSPVEELDPAGLAPLNFAVPAVGPLSHARH